jgi:hypothetical protein
MAAVDVPSSSETWLRRELSREETDAADKRAAEQERRRHEVEMKMPGLVPGIASREVLKA